MPALPVIQDTSIKHQPRFMSTKRSPAKVEACAGNKIRRRNDRI
jgi:hypothetical protein